MAISDINKAMGLYAQPSEFDQNAWKTAFDMADRFAQTSEKHRANRENLDTSIWRVALQNATNQAGAAEQQNKLTQANAMQQGWDFLQQNAVDQNGRVRNAEELFNLAQHQKLNPALYAQLFAANQNYAQNAAQEIAPINASMASQYRTMAGLSPNLVDNEGNVINFNSGATVGTIPDPYTLASFGAGKTWQGFENIFKAQQEAEKARAVAEARLPSTLAAIEARGQNALDRQENWAGIKQNSALAKEFGEALSNSVDLKSGDFTQEAFAKELSNLVNKYGHDANAMKEINAWADSVVRNQGWQIPQK